MPYIKKPLPGHPDMRTIQWGPNGHRYPYHIDSKQSENLAKARALEQMRAIKWRQHQKHL